MCVHAYVCAESSKWCIGTCGLSTGLVSWRRRSTHILWATCWQRLRQWYTQFVVALHATPLGHDFVVAHTNPQPQLCSQKLSEDHMCLGLCAEKKSYHTLHSVHVAPKSRKQTEAVLINDVERSSRVIQLFIRRRCAISQCRLAQCWRSNVYSIWCVWASWEWGEEYSRLASKDKRRVSGW